MHLRGTLVAPLVAAGRPGHEQLWVRRLDLTQEGASGVAAQTRRSATVVGDDDERITPHGVLETLGVGHLPSVQVWRAPGQCRTGVACTFTRSGIT